MNNNRLTASQMAEELTIKTGKKVTVTKVQKVLENLDYVKKEGKRYVPTEEKGIYYSEKGIMYQNGYNVVFYKWDKSLINEIAYELEG